MTDVRHIAPNQIAPVIDVRLHGPLAKKYGKRFEPPKLLREIPLLAVSDLVGSVDRALYQELLRRTEENEVFDLRENQLAKLGRLTRK